MNLQETEVTAHRDEAAFRRDYPVVWILISGITVIAVIVLMLNHRYRQLKARQTTP